MRGFRKDEMAGLKFERQFKKRRRTSDLSGKIMEEDFDFNPTGADSDQEVEYEVDDKKHSKLLDAISSLDGKKRLASSQRTLPARQISEFNFSTSGGLGKVHLSELVGTLKEETSHGALKKQLQSVEKRTKVVPTPLPKPEQDRIQRSLAYETTTEEVSKWDSIVHKNRKAEQLRFPLEQPDLKVLTTTDAFIKRFQPRTPLEKEVATLLHGSDSVLSKTQILTAAEERALKAMDVEEAKMRRAELQKYRALLSYKESKARWQKKIKSKRYHKHMRKSKQKEELKAVEELQRNDPEAYQEKMKQIEKDRIEERMNLKHRGGSKFIQKQKIYSKYQDQARQAVQDMYQKSRELTQKTKVDSDSDNESGVSMDSGDELKMVESDNKGNNPWMSMNPGGKIRIKTVEDLEKEENEAKLKLNKPHDEDFIHIGTENDSLMKDDDSAKNETAEQYLEHKNKKSKNLVQQKRKRKKKSASNTATEDNNSEDQVKNVDTAKDTNQELDDMFKNLENESVEKVVNKKDQKRKKKNKGNKIVSKNSVRKKEAASKDENVEISDEDEEIIQESLTKKSKYEDFENDSENDESDEVDNSTTKLKKQKVKESSNSKGVKSAEVYVDPKKLFALDTAIRSSALPDLVVNDDEDITETDQRMTIAEAFADDDVIEEFTQDKAEAKKKDKMSDIDLTLPGWGEWGGSGIKPSERKKRRFTLKAPLGPPRKDRLLGHVIINEEKDKAIAKHQVSHLPFPYTSIQQFEQSVRAPVGKNWNPETAFKLLTKPKVVTRLGTVIKPIDKSQVFKKENTSKANKADISFKYDQKDKNKFLSRKKKQKLKRK